MVDRQVWGFIGLISCFFSVYLASLVYSIFPTTAGWSVEPFTPTQSGWAYTANATISGTSSLSSWLPLIAIVLGAGVVISTLVGAFSFREAMK